MREKKKALRERAVEYRYNAFVKTSDWFENHWPVFRTVGRLDFYWIPGDMIAYMELYHPEGWTIFKDWILPMISSVVGSLLGVLIYWKYFTH